jgi:hypothetical protein
MSQPTKGDVHVNAPLTNISIAYLQQPSNFVAGAVFPNVPVMKQSDRYFLYERGQWFRDEMEKRAPGTESRGSGYTIDNTPTYYCDVWALHKDIDDQTRSNADQPIDMDRDATEFLTQKWLIRRERQFVANHFTTGLWTGSSTGADIVAATKWDAAAGDPMADVDVELDAMGEKTGKRPNIMVVTPAVHRAIRNNAQVLDRFKYTQRAVLTEELLAMLFGVERYLVARGTYNTAKEGATPSYQYIFGTGEGCGLFYAEKNPGIMKPSAGYTFGWKGFFGAGDAGNRMKKFRMEELASDRVEIEACFDLKLVAADLGVFFSDVLT